MPQKSPSNLRSPRNRALEIGTKPVGFIENAAGPYDPQAGTPADAAGGHYHHEGGVPDPGPPINPSPFKLGQ